MTFKKQNKQNNNKKTTTKQVEGDRRGIGCWKMKMKDQRLGDDGIKACVWQMMTDGKSVSGS